MTADIHRLVRTWASLALLAALVSVPPALADDESDYGVLHDATGVEETFAYCAGCHSERLVAQQGLTREDWDDLLVWMVEEQGMAAIDAPDRAVVLDYLSTHYGPDRPNFPRAAK